MDFKHAIDKFVFKVFSIKKNAKKKPFALFQMNDLIRNHIKWFNVQCSMYTITKSRRFLVNIINLVKSERAM